MRLPQEQRIEKITGKVGRTTFSTLAMNNGQGELATSIATKHRDPKTMLGYVKANDGFLMEASLGIGASMKRSTHSNRIAGVDFDQDIAEVDADASIEYCHSTSNMKRSSEIANQFDATEPFDEDDSESVEVDDPIPKKIKKTTTITKSDGHTTKTIINNFYL